MWESLYKNLFPVSQTGEGKNVFSPCSEKQKTGSDYIPASAASLNVSVRTAEGYSEFRSYSTFGKMACSTAAYLSGTYPQRFMTEKLAER